MDNTVFILGSGPSGLLAALAAEQKGYQPKIISLGEPSPIGGAQWLQRSIPGLTDNIEPEMLTYAKVGSVDGYAQKAYGEPEAQVSWESFVSGDRPGWSMRKSYERLWDRFESKISKARLNPSDVEGLARGAQSVGRLVFSSIPLSMICRDLAAHDFESKEVVFTDEEFVRVPNMIVYNGRESDAWYRTSCIFGECSTEYALDHAPPWANGEVRTGIKPVKNNCNCWASYPNLIRIGRFGQWRRGVLIDHAYAEVGDRL